MTEANIPEAFELLCKLVAVLSRSGGSAEASVVLQPQAFRVEDAAAYIGVSRSRFYELKDQPHWDAPRNKGPQIPVTEVDGQPRYLKKHLDAYLKHCEKGK